MGNQLCTTSAECTAPLVCRPPMGNPMGAMACRNPLPVMDAGGGTPDTGAVADTGGGG
jgi:hypothetical protein